MSFSPSKPVPAHVRETIARLLPLSSREDVAAAVGCHPSTVIRIARSMGVPIRPRGCNPYLGVPTYYVKTNPGGWELFPRGQTPARWMQP
jgi:hypothetical protein